MNWFRWLLRKRVCDEACPAFRQSPVDLQRALVARKNTLPSLPDPYRMHGAQSAGNRRDEQTRRERQRGSREGDDMKHLDEMLKNPVTVAVILLLALGVAGTDDYEHAIAQHKTLCEKGATKPEWCR